MDVKLSRAGEEWLVYIELVKFVETMLLTGQNALSRSHGEAPRESNSACPRTLK
jgi:hypothetical protein